MCGFSLNPPPPPPPTNKLIVDQSTILNMADRPTINLYAGSPVYVGSSAIYEIVYCCFSSYAVTMKRISPECPQRERQCSLPERRPCRKASSGRHGTQCNHSHDSVRFENTENRSCGMPAWKIEGEAKRALASWQLSFQCCR